MQIILLNYATPSPLPWKMSLPLFQQPPSKNWDTAKPSFWKFGWRSNHSISWCLNVWHVATVVFCWYSDSISHNYTHTDTHKDTQHTQGLLDWQTHVNIYLATPTAIYVATHSSYLYCKYNEWIIHWYQNFTFHNVSSFQKLFTC